MELAPKPPEASELELLCEEWKLYLEAAHAERQTTRNYPGTARRFAAYLRDEHGIDDAWSIRPEHAQGFLARKGFADRTRRTYDEHLRLFAKWLLQQGEISWDFMAGVKRPKVGDKVVPVVPEDDLRKLLKACSGNYFGERRDTAMIRFALDTGVRVSELVGLRVHDIDLDTRRAVVMGKGRRQRWVRMGAQTTLALRRYLRRRNQHPRGRDVDALWIGDRGPLTASGFTQLLRRRCRQAGIPEINPHRLRNTWAHLSLQAGAREGDLLVLGGWKDPTMLRRYAASGETERALDAHDDFSPGDRL